MWRLVYATAFLVSGVQLIAVSVVGAALLSVYLYARSFTPGVILAKGGNTGYAVYDFFIGR